MKKLLVFITAALGAITVLGMAAIGGMAVLEDSEMAEVTGQVGIKIDMSLEATGGFLGLYDTDGMYPVTGSAWKGCLTLGSFWARGAATSGTPYSATGWTLDVGSTSSGGNSYLQIGMGALTSGFDSGFGFDSVKIGTMPDKGFNTQTVRITDLNLNGSSIRIEGT